MIVQTDCVHLRNVQSFAIHISVPSGVSAHECLVLNSVVKAIEETAASSIRITPPNIPQSQAFCPEINRMSHEQKMLRLRIDNTKDAEMSNALKQKRNRLQHAIRRKTLDNATNILDQKIK